MLKWKPEEIEREGGRDRERMGRVPCCNEMGMKKGPWTPEEDRILVSYIQRHGHANWRALPKQAGLSRCGKSCRLRWTNYLRPDVKRGDLSKEEEDNIIYLHAMLGNRWSAIAAKFPGRTDNEIKNVWHTHLKKRLSPNQLIMDHSNRRNRMINSMNTTQTNMIVSGYRVSPTLSSEIAAEDRNNVCGERSIVNSLEELLEIDEKLMSRASPAGKNCSSEEDDDSALGAWLEHARISSDEDDIRFWLNLLAEAGHLEFK